VTLNHVTVVLYETPSGATPVEAFLDSLPPKIYRKAFWTLHTIQTLGRAHSHYFKAMKGTGGLYEVRVSAARGALRLLGFFAPESLFVLLHGFLKKTQHTPSNEIAIARQRKDEYLRRCREDP